MSIQALSTNRAIRRYKRVLAKVAENKSHLKLVWSTPNFDKQNDFVFSKAKRVLAQCTRRAGKSYAVGKKLFKEAEENPGCNVLYLALTRSSAKRILFKDILKAIAREQGIKCKFNASDLTVTLPNESVIYLGGADNSVKDMDKLLGSKYRLACVDEAAFFRLDLEYLIEEILDAALADLDGQMVLISTPGPNIHSYFFKACIGEIKGWEVHKWSALENPFGNWAKKIQEKIDRDPNVVHTPAFKRMYKNEWVIDNDLQCYKFTENNLIKKLPPPKNGAKWIYGLGVDLGWEDPTAFVVVAWNKYDPCLYIVHSFKKSHMDLLDVAEYTSELESYYGSFRFKVIDNAAKQSVETMRLRFGVSFSPASKSGKKDHIEMMNTELAALKVKVVTQAGFSQGTFKVGEEIKNPTLNEWIGLVWDEGKKKKGIWEEDPACPNHISDAALYSWREAYPYLVKEVEESIKYDSEEVIDKFVEKEDNAFKNKKQGFEDLNELAPCFDDEEQRRWGNSY